MKSGDKFTRLRNQGAAMLFALLILGIAAMVLAGSVVVMNALVEHTLATQTAITRRLTLENSRAMAQQLVRYQILQQNSTAAFTGTSISDNGDYLGGLIVAGASPWTTTDRSGGGNPFSPAGETKVGTNYYSGYVTNLVATLFTTSGTVAWNFEARSRTPSLGYDLASYSGTAASSYVTSAAAISTSKGPYYSGTLQNAASPPDIVYSNFLTSATTGVTATINAATTGTLVTTSHATSGSGTVMAFLNGPDQSSTLLITGSLSSLTFNYWGSGTVTPNYPLRVVCSGNTATCTVNIPQGSTRPIYLFFNNSSAVTLTHSSTPRLTGLFLNTTLTIGSGVIRGGLRSNGSVSSGGTLNILRDTDPGTLDAVSLRRGWVESYRND